MALPAKAASPQRVTANWGTNNITTRVVMDIYVPNNIVANAPIVVCLHHCGGWGTLSFGENPDLVAAADQYGFIIILPSALNSDGSFGRCWDNESNQALTRFGGGDSHAIANMVNYTVNTYGANRNRVYAQGGSSGAMMTETMLAIYPDVFKAGVAFAGVTPGSSGWDSHIKHTPKEWGDIIRARFPGYTGPRPRAQLWHGTADPIVAYSNVVESAEEFSNLLGLSDTPTLNITQTVLALNPQFIHQVWQNACGDTLLETWSEIGGNHGSDAWKASMYLSFLGLDVVGPTDPVAPCNNPSNSRYKVIARHSGKAMEAAANGTANGTQIQQWSYLGGASQQWGITNVGGNVYQIMGVQSGKSVDISNSGTGNGTKVQLWSYLGAANQKFTLNATDSGYYRITPTHATGSCLDVNGVSTADGALVHLWQWLSGLNQQWAVQPLQLIRPLPVNPPPPANGTYKIIARHSGKALDAAGQGTGNGTQIHQWTYLGGNNQRWTVTNRGNNQYSIIGVQSGRAVEVSGGGTANGTKIQLWDYQGTAHQKFTIQATAGGYYRLSPTHATGSCLDVSNGSTGDGALVQLWTYGANAHQQWAFQAP